MLIEKISNNFDERREPFKLVRSLKKVNRNRPMDAVAFDSTPSGTGHNSRDCEKSWLETYVALIPDEDVKERMKKFTDSFESVDDCIIDKLIIEEL